MGNTLAAVWGPVLASAPLMQFLRCWEITDLASLAAPSSFGRGGLGGGSALEPGRVWPPVAFRVADPGALAGARSPLI